MHTSSTSTPSFLTLSLLTCLILLIPLTAAAAFNLDSSTAPTELLGPTGSGFFGANVTILPNGNIVVADPLYDSGSIQDAGAVYLYDGQTGELISALTGAHINDKAGELPVIVLSSGNFVVSTPFWDSETAIDAGAVTWCSAMTGCAGEIGPANSLVGSMAYDWAGQAGIHSLENGSYIVRSPWWNNSAIVDAGAVTWCSGESGCSGPVAPENSLTGVSPSDNLGFDPIVELSSSDYVILSSRWDDGSITNAEAATWCPGTLACVGTITDANSLFGVKKAAALANGNYVLMSDNTVSWCPGGAACTASTVSIKQLAGSFLNGRITTLTNGSYVIEAPADTSAAPGAVTFCDGAIGCSGSIDATNSLVGIASASTMESNRGILELKNGNYVVLDSTWNNGLGAVVWCSGSAGCTGTVASNNSLTGSNYGDQVGRAGIVPLANGNYTVNSPGWKNGPSSGYGAITFCDGQAGCDGIITPDNSLIGTCTNNCQYDSYYSAPKVQALETGNYIISHFALRDVNSQITMAITFCSGTTGCAGTIHAGNSMIWQNKYAYYDAAQAVVLANGSYIVSDPTWSSESAPGMGFFTLCDGIAGCTGGIETNRTVFGPYPNCYFGANILGLTNGNFVLRYSSTCSPEAVRWCPAWEGCADASVSPLTSLTGRYVAIANPNSSYQGKLLESLNGLVALSDGNYLVISSRWQESGVQFAGAVTVGDGANGYTTGYIINDSNSVYGRIPNTDSYGALLIIDYNPLLALLVVGFPRENRVALLHTSFHPNGRQFLPLVTK